MLQAEREQLGQRQHFVDWMDSVGHCKAPMPTMRILLLHCMPMLCACVHKDGAMGDSAKVYSAASSRIRRQLRDSVRRHNVHGNRLKTAKRRPSLIILGSAIILPMLDMPGIARRPHATERNRVGHGAEYHRSGQSRLQQAGLPGAPCHDVVDLERDADAEQQRERDDVGEIEREADPARKFPASPRRRAGSGIGVSSTSLTRLKAMKSKIAIATSARMPASIKAAVTVLADS